MSNGELVSHMWESIDNVFGRFDPLAASTLAHDAVVIRPAHDADLVALHDLAELDSAAPLTGPVLVALIDGRPWAALGLDDGRVIADPFRESGAAVELLRLRVTQLRAAESPAPRAAVARWGRGGLGLRRLGGLGGTGGAERW
jgi:hypothetical protein